MVRENIHCEKEEIYSLCAKKSSSGNGLKNKKLDDVLKPYVAWFHQGRSTASNQNILND